MIAKVTKILKNKGKGVTGDELSNRTNSLPVVEWKPGDIILERYLVDKVYSGAMGRVYIAEHLGWKVPLAIKAPKPEILANKEGLKRILTEANAWVKMGMHPNVATCYYVLNIDETPYLFIEYVDGGDLSSWLKSGRCKDQRTILNMAVQFCHGMEFTHSKGIIHRDIKPGNILLTKNALLKITDFGIVQTINSQNTDQPLTQTQSEKTIGFRGTPNYASPEQFRDTHSVDLRSDIFSFGICLWLMFCGRRPYINNAQQGKAVPTPADPKSPFPAILKELLSKAVAFDPKDRFQNFSELRQALNETHIALFKVPCPFMDLDFSDLQAENFNNRAISFLELGKTLEGKKFLQRALDENDTLPEVLFNFTLLQWQEGKDGVLLIQQVEAFRKRFPKAPLLDTLAQAIRCDLHKDAWAIPDDERDTEEPACPLQTTNFPEYMLCLPKNSVDIFQTSQLNKAAKLNMADLLKKKRYRECSEILFMVWESTNFRKDAELKRVYEQLLAVGTPKKLRSVIRLQTLRNSSTIAQKLLCRPGKQKFFVLGTDGKLLLHSPNTSKNPEILGNYTSVCATTLSPDKSLLVIASKGGGIDCISLDSGKSKARLSTSGTITAIALNRDNTLIAAGFSDGTITLFSLKNKKEDHLSATEGGAITALNCFNRSDDFISGSEDGNMRFWSANQQKPIRIVQAHSKAIQTISASANELFCVSGADDRQVKTWDRQTGQCKKTVSTEEKHLRASLILPNNDYILAAGSNDIITVWKTLSDKPAFLLDGRGDGITSLASGSSPHIFLAGCQDGSIIYWMLVYDLEFS